ncbi:hypothetical protein, partial [Candidatus Pelagibacter ubique]|uniref:hypothetical protein n=1 Tax=Pelagibacter ubique TaxID=198252 RepID=UPI00241C593F
YSKVKNIAITILFIFCVPINAYASQTFTPKSAANVAGLRPWALSLQSLLRLIAKDLSAYGL